MKYVFLSVFLFSFSCFSADAWSWKLLKSSNQLVNENKTDEEIVDLNKKYSKIIKNKMNDKDDKKIAIKYCMEQINHLLLFVYLSKILDRNFLYYDLSDKISETTLLYIMVQYSYKDENIFSVAIKNNFISFNPDVFYDIIHKNIKNFPKALTQESVILFEFICDIEIEKCQEKNLIKPDWNNK